jgi:hypothetical protein
MPLRSEGGVVRVGDLKQLRAEIEKHRNKSLSGRQGEKKWIIDLRNERAAQLFMAAESGSDEAPV